MVLHFGHLIRKYTSKNSKTKKNSRKKSHLGGVGFCHQGEPSFVVAKIRLRKSSFSWCGGKNPVKKEKFTLVAFLFVSGRGLGRAVSILYYQKTNLGRAVAATFS